MNGGRPHNPYTLSFGKKPLQSISREGEVSEVMEMFFNDPPTHQAYMITGVRGSGKTVLMTEIRNAIKEQPGWEAIELSSSEELLTSLAQHLYQDKSFARIFKQGGGLNVMGFGIEFNGSQESLPPQIAIREVLVRLKKQGKRLLICIDEIVANEYVRKFASEFQILIRDDLPIYLLMTGLYENIRSLQDEKNLTFLYRTPQIKVKPLNLGAIALNYQAQFGISTEEAEKMAALTKGYSFAFQVLGYLTYRHKGDYKSALPEYKQYLEDYVYEKIWSELSLVDRKVLNAAASSKTGKAAEIKELCGLSNNEYTPYRERLIRKMIVDGEEYGYLRFVLPFMEEYVRRSWRMAELQEGI